GRVAEVRAFGNGAVGAVRGESLAEAGRPVIDISHERPVWRIAERLRREEAGKDSVIRPRSIGMSAKIIVADDKAVVRIVPAAGAIERVTKIGALEHSGSAAIIGEIAICGDVQYW